MPTRPSDDAELIDRYDRSDAYEQQRSDVPHEGDADPPDTLPFEAPEADVLEQHQPVPLDDGDDYRG
jgi:hypothetical protein